MYVIVQLAEFPDPLSVHVSPGEKEPGEDGGNVPEIVTDPVGVIPDESSSVTVIVHVNAAPSYATGVDPLVNATVVVVPVVTVKSTALLLDVMK